MVYDQYKKLHINYNIFNLPDTLSVTGQGKIVNQYLADGTLLRRSFFDEDDNEIKRIDYQGEFLFVNGQLNKVFTEEGYYQPTAATKTKKSDFGTYFYTLKDHLGHTRVVVDEEENVIQETAYYPYGGIIADLSTKTKYNYLYTGKEFIDSLGVNWYDHHARYYDAEVGRWFAIDPALQAASPYMAMGNSPMIYIDADGRTWKIFEKIGDAIETAWEGFWLAANQFARWADDVGIPDAQVGYGINPQGQVQPVGNINGQPLFSNEAQYEAAAQNAVGAINDARGDYFSQQSQNRIYDQQVNNRIMRIGLQQGYPASSDGGAYDGGYMISASAYDYSQGVISGKMREDWLYWKNGGPWYEFGMRATETFWRDATARENRGAVMEAGAMVFISGFGKVAKPIFHRVIKPGILKAVGKSNYMKRVGSNPDIQIINNQIRLNGNGPYKNKYYDTGLDPIVFFD